MKVYNPTSSNLEVVIEGFPYSVEAYGESKSIDDRHALHWKERIHEFIILRKDDEKPKAASVAKAPEVEKTPEVELPQAPMAMIAPDAEVAPQEDEKKEEKVEEVKEIKPKTSTKK